MNEIGSKKDELKESNIGSPRMGGDFSHGIIVKELPVVFLDGSSQVVKQIDPPRRGLEIGDKNMIDVFSVFEQSKLVRLYRVVRYGTSDHNKAVQFVPFLMNFVFEFSNFPSVLQVSEPASLSSGFDGRVFFGDDYVSASSTVEEADDSLSIEPGIHPKPNACSGDSLGNLGQTDFEKRDRSCGCYRVPRTKTSMPEFLEMSFETENGMIRASSGFLGIVPDTRPFRFAVKDDDHRVYIEHQRRSRVG
jgi:hypothetical protein